MHKFFLFGNKISITSLSELLIFTSKLGIGVIWSMLAGLLGFFQVFLKF